MPRKEFQRDLIQASVPGRFPRLEGVRAGDEHGSVLYTYIVPFSNETFDFQTSVLDTHDYPGHHTYFTFAASDNVPDDVSKAIERLQPTVARLAIGPFLECISNSIDNTLLGVGSSLDSFHEDPSESEIFSGDDDMDFDVDSDAQFTPPTDKAKVMKQIRSDMGTVKKAGYRVGFLGELTECLIVSVSCRIGKLGISKVAMQAWNVRPSQYLVLLLRYPLGYCNLDEVIEKSGPKTPRILMHVGLCDSYKPSSTSALQAFLSTDAETPGNTKKVEPELQSFFIGDSLDTLLNTHFIALVRYRLQHGFTWTGSELFLKNSQSTSPDSKEVTRGVYFVPDSWNAATPRFLRADHIGEGRTPLSLPLSAIQFTLRRFVKCTEFCLNCFCKVEAGFEALMPYVCSNSLCLYQYMRLGMGPSLEWEIISQPYVVDMLVSFTYARAMAGYLEDFPTGIGMNVPYSANTQTQLVYHGQLNQSTMVLDARDTPDLRVGDWILIVPSGAHIRHGRPQWHCRVQDADFPSAIRLSPPVIRWTPDGQGVKLEGSGAVQFMRYNGCFDGLPDSAKCESIIMLLDTLPNVNSMRSFISSHSNGSSKRALASWCDRISPAALYVLRWIVASNRSCIRYEDDPEHQIPHLNGHAQFRLAQGAPDKEQRFVSAVKSLSSSHNPEYPTLFAWHGSPLSNWHSILREGFHFRTIAHGRSRGDGVYMSRHFGYSLSYASSHHLNKAWPNSTLNIDRALSLNEIVNAPEQFVFNGEHYVVDKLDWIQPRYLIVGHRSASLIMGDTRLEPSMTYTQDPSYEASGPTGRALTLPISAVSSHWSHPHTETTPRNTREGQVSHDVMPMADDDLDSVITFTDDDWLLETDGVGSTDTNYEAAKEVFHDLSKTDFRPGRLEESTLQLLGPPKYATTMATKSLQRHLQATLKVQEREPLSALGWYIDPNLVNNVYQWIVQLHSFEPSLPLSQDLEVAGLTSIVMELRFPPQFPMSPPFVRIIRPRFLPFSQGGGGHVTAGGAMCMELLTSSGWSPVSSIESVLLQVRMALTSTDPIPARLDQRRTQDYAVGEAVAAYTRVCQLHGWKVPDDLQQVSW